MAQLIVGNLENDLVCRLKKQAGVHGVSTEEEHRQILKSALPPDSESSRISFKTHLMGMPKFEDDSIFARFKEDCGRASEQNIL